MIRRPPRSTPSDSSAASDVYKRQDLRSVQVKRARLSTGGPPGQQGREATELGARRSWEVCGCSLSPGSNMSQCQACRQRLPVTHQGSPTVPWGQIYKNALRGVRFRAWLSDPSVFSGPHPVTANSLDLFHPADQGCLHSHVTEVVSAVTESMEIVPKALCLSV